MQSYSHSCNSQQHVLNNDHQCTVAVTCPSAYLSLNNSSASYAAQAQLPDIQGTGGVYFAGAWASYGFHEDGIKAGVAVAKLLGAAIPWGAGISTSPKMGLGDMLWLTLFDR